MNNMNPQLVRIVVTLVALKLILPAAVASAQAKPAPSKQAAEDAAYLREHYTKFEYRIPMRDGVKLFTAVYAPKDDSQPYPILLTRTPYSVKPYGVDVYPDEPRGPLARYAKERFIFVLQDVRGRYGSEGTFVQM